METQEKIRFDNMLAHEQGSEYIKYSYQSVGMVIHFLYVYGLPQYDTATISFNSVTLFGETIATYTWNKRLRMPIFTFYSRKYEYLLEAQEIYLNGIKKAE